MVIADDHSNFGLSGVLILLMANDCNGAGMMACRRPGWLLRRL